MTIACLVMTHPDHTLTHFLIVLFLASHVFCFRLSNSKWAELGVVFCRKTSREHCSRLSTNAPPLLLTLLVSCAAGPCSAYNTLITNKPLFDYWECLLLISTDKLASLLHRLFILKPKWRAVFQKFVNTPDIHQRLNDFTVYSFVVYCIHDMKH